MADFENGPIQQTSKSPQAKQEMSMERRLLLAFGLMGLVLLGSQYLFPPATPPPPAAGKSASQEQEKAKTEQTPAKAETQSAPAGNAAAPAPAVSTVEAAPAPVAAEKPETYVIETDQYRVVFSNRGASVRSWVLKKYLDNTRKPVDVVSQAAASTAGWPFAYIMRGDKSETDLNQVLFAATQPDPLSLVFEYSNGRITARKSFSFIRDRYQVKFHSEVTSGGRSLSHLLAWRGGFGDRTAHNAAGAMQSVVYDLSRNKLVVESSSIAKNGPVTVTGSYSFAGLQDTYFAAVVLPEPGESLDFQTWQDKFPIEKDGDPVDHVGVAWGTKGVIDETLFVGPKDTDILKATNPKLDQLIDWGWFAIIAKPLFLALHWLNDNLTSNWGWAIVLATVIINLLMLPLKFSSLRSMQKMAKLQPQIQAINERYKGVSMKDPKKQQQNQEMMALYQKEGINPLGGCVPLILQMPFFFAFFKVLSVAIELRGAPWLWVPDLSQPELSWFRILPIAMLGSQVLMQKMTPSTTADPSQQRMMMLMPIVLGVMFYSASSGLVLYWLTGNVVGIVQQYFFNKMAPVASPAPVQKSASQKRKK